MPKHKTARIYFECTFGRSITDIRYCKVRAPQKRISVIAIPAGPLYEVSVKYCAVL